MGLNTVLVILNDHLHAIRDDPEFGRKVHDMVMMWPSVDVRATDSARVVSMAHADYEQMVTVQHGHGKYMEADEQEAVHKHRRARQLRAKREAK